MLYETPDGTLAVTPSSHVMSELHHILETAPPTNEYPVGILTNEHRDTWYQARERLRKGTACVSIPPCVFSRQLSLRARNLCSDCPMSKLINSSQNYLSNGVLKQHFTSSVIPPILTTSPDPQNQACLEDIETSILTVSLDKAHPHTMNFDPSQPFNDYQRSLVAGNFLHGNGSQLNSINRWSDTCIQV